MAARVLAAGSLLAAVAQASPVYGNGTATDGVVYTTEVVTALTTFCPGPTQITHGSSTYTVTEATTLTITDCPCTVTKPAAPTSTPSSPENKCAKDCYDAYNACRVKPQANMSFCAAQYASCLGYSPFGDDGSLITPSACSAQPSATATPSTPGHVVYTTEVVTAITTYCPAPTTVSFNNVTYTVTEPTTLTVTDCPCTISKPHPSASQPATPDCPTECYNAYNMCRGSPDANMATCAAKYASCLGYSPFGPDGSLIKPTACSKAPSAPTTAPAQPPVTTTAPSEPKTTLPVKDCAAKCYDAYNVCRSQPNASRPTCAGEFASCLGYSPFDESGSLVTPTACSTGATGVTVPATSAATAPATTPGAPGAPVTTPLPGAAGRVAPAGALLVLGAVALL